MPHDSPLSILLIEDDPIHARITRSLLQDRCGPIQVTHVSDGESAVQLIVEEIPRPSAPSRGQALPDLLLLDIRLPRMDGFEVLQAIRADVRVRHLPVVMVSTSDRGDDVNRSYRLGANAFICKSPDLDEYTDRLEAVCRFWRRVQRPTASEQD